MVPRRVVAEHLLILFGETDLFQRVEPRRFVQQAHDDAFAVGGRHGADSNVDLAIADSNRCAAVLGEPPLGDVHLAHHLHAANDGLVRLAGHRIHVVEDAVDPEPHLGAVGVGVEVHIGCAQLQGLEEDRVDELDDRGLVGRVEHVFGLFDLVGEGGDITVLGHVGKGFIHAVGLVPIGPRDQRRDLGARREDRLDLGSEERGQVVHRIGIQG